MNSTVFSHHKQELKESSIDDSLIWLNVSSSESYNVLNKYFQYWEGDRTNTGRPQLKYLRNIDHLSAGAWFVYLHTKKGLIPHFKPDNPKPDSRKEGKLIKYLQIQGAPNGVFFPEITYYHVKLIAQRYNISDYPQGELDAHCEEALEWIISHKEIPIGVTEGSKKSMALMSIGIPAVAFSGVWNFNTSKVDKTLIPFLKNFTGHKFVFYNDNDQKPKTRRHVGKAERELIRQLSILGISKEFEKCTWSNTKSKGIDDYLYDHNRDEKHLKYEEFVRGQTFRNVTPDLILNTRYLTDENKKCLPQITKVLDENKVVAIKSAKGTGKTVAIADYNAKFAEVGTKQLVPTHRVQLMSELSQKLQIANASNHMISLDEVFGICLCVDSLHQFSSVKFDVERFTDCVVFIDEIDQVLDHLINASTEVKKHRCTVMKNIVTLLQSASKVIVSSADLTQDVIDFLEKNTKEKVFVIENEYKPKSGTCTIFTQGRPDVFLQEFENHAIKKGENVALFTASQKITSSNSTQNLEKYYKRKYPHLIVMRIDAETVVDPTRKEFNCMENINNFIQTYQPDILFISPVLETGIDISITDYFDSYWGMNWGISSVNSFSQAMGRIRESIPRYIWSSNSSPFVIGNGSLYESGLVMAEEDRAKLNELIFQHFDDELNYEANDSFLRYWAERGAIINTQSKHLVKSVIAKFASDYEHIRINDSTIEKEEKQKIKAAIKNNKEINTKEEYAKIVAAPLLNDVEYKKLKDKKQKTKDERLIERKNSLTRYIAPKSKKVEITPALLKLEDDKLLLKINTHWLLTLGLETTQKIDKMRLKEKEFVLDMNKKLMSAKIAYLVRFKVLEIINNPDEVYHSKHPLIIEVGNNIRAGFNRLAEGDFTIKDLWAIGRLSPKSTEWNLVKWCLLLLGFELKPSRIVEGVRFYFLLDNASANRQIIFDFWNSEKLDFEL